MKKLLFFFSILLIITACKHKNANFVVKTNKSGSTDSTYFNVTGTDSEKVKEVKRYPNKQVEMAGEYKDNKRNGYWVAYYPDGKKWSEGNFVDGLDDGLHTVYFENGNVRYEGNYVKGKQVGIWKFYNKDGKLMKEKNYDKTDPTIATKQKSS
jgi:antitoxin component YwqK of YwqJK toxin-antitoxin module